MAELNRIRYIDIKDFRCLEQVHISFEESPIVCLQAGNDGGKSSVVKAMQTIMYNDNNSISKGFIRTGTSGFKIDVTMEDGTVIERERGAVGNVYRLFSADGKLLSEHTKLEKGTVPPEIARIFNVFVEEEKGELLNIRTCESLLLFALTTPSENYKMMHSGLKVNQISDALTLGKNELNSIKYSINTDAGVIESMQQQLRQIKVPDLTPVEQLDERIDETVKLLGETQKVLDDMCHVRNMRNSMDSTSAAIANLSTIDERLAMAIDNMAEVISRKANLCSCRDTLSRMTAEQEPDEISYDAIQRINELEAANSAVKQLRELKDAADRENVNELNALESLSDTTVVELGNIIVGCRNTADLKRSLDAMLAEEAQMEKQFNEMLKSSGLYYSISDNAIVTKCENCGEENKVTLDAIVSACEAIG